MTAHTIYLHRQPDGSYMNWGRHGAGKHKGTGGARCYYGEAAKVTELVVKSFERKA
jgi:hypothetical protein